MNRIYALIVFFMAAASICLQAQVLPPTITCITNDTLFYEPVANSCGPFVSLDVFTASNENGPYNLLGSITDEAANFLAHPNSSSQPAFYYIVPNFDCPGSTVINSDTISNRPPSVAVLQTVNVDNDNITLIWDPSPSPETVLYSVFLLTDMGLELLIQTPDNTFTDLVQDPDQSTYSYLLVAIDACGNRSIFGDPVSSMFLTTSLVPCEEEVSFNWNRHIGADQQELWAISSDGTETFIQDLPTGAEEYILTDIPNIDIEGFFIRGYINGDPNKIANSNITFVNNEVITKMDEIFFTQVAVQNENSVLVEWCWNKDADLSKYEIRHTSSSINSSVEENIFSTLTTTDSDQINLNNTNAEINTIRLVSTDQCDGVFESVEIETSLLTVSPQSENELEIKWNAFKYSDAMLIAYELHEVKDGLDEIIYEGSNSQLLYPRSSDGGESCFYVITKADGLLIDGSRKETLVKSNTACSKGFPIIRMPNAFNPYGVNSIFRPLAGNSDAIASYQMKVFSRYGELLFLSEQIEKGWNGRTGLKELPQGVYSYLVEVEVIGGEKVRLQGSVMLIR